MLSNETIPIDDTKFEAAFPQNLILCRSCLVAKGCSKNVYVGYTPKCDVCGLESFQAFRVVG